MERGRSRHTRRAYVTDLRLLFAFVDERAPGARSRRVELPLLRSWLAAGSAGGAARTTLARRTSAVKTFTSWAARRGPRIPADPAVRLSSRPATPLPAVLREDQARAAMVAAGLGAQEGDPLALRDRLIVEMLYATGIRVSELCGLDIDDVDTGRRVLRVLGKGNKQRTVPFGSPALAALNSWLSGGACGVGDRRLRAGAATRSARPPTPIPIRPAPSCTRRSPRSGCPRTSDRMDFGTAPPPTCSRVVQTFGWCRNCSVTPHWPLPSSTPMSPWPDSAP